VSCVPLPLRLHLKRPDVAGHSESAGAVHGPTPAVFGTRTADPFWRIWDRAGRRLRSLRVARTCANIGFAHARAVTRIHQAPGPLFDWREIAKPISWIADVLGAVVEAFARIRGFAYSTFEEALVMGAVDAVVTHAPAPGILLAHVYNAYTRGLATSGADRPWGCIRVRTRTALGKPKLEAKRRCRAFLAVIWTVVVVNGPLAMKRSVFGAPDRAHDAQHKQQGKMKRIPHNKPPDRPA